MGVVLDSSVLIAGERRRESLREILKRVRVAQGEIDCAISVVTIVELTHGIYRAKADEDRERRRAFHQPRRKTDESSTRSRYQPDNSGSAPIASGRGASPQGQSTESVHCRIISWAFVL
jgi:hypothetical protein